MGEDERIAKTVQELLAEVSATRSDVNQRLSFEGKPLPDVLLALQTATKALEDRQIRRARVDEDHLDRDAAARSAQGRCRPSRSAARAYFLPPKMSTTVLSYLEDTTDVTGLVSNTNISGPFPVDNIRLDEAASCQTNCFANSPSANFLDAVQLVRAAILPARPQGP